MDASASADFLRLFTELQDPRRENRRSLLSDILLLAVSAVLCGCEGWQDIEDWTEDAFEFLQPLMLQVSTERRYYIASHRKLDAKRTAEAIGGHWGIENQVRWVLDVTFNEDQSRIRRGHGAENFSRLRRMVLNQLRAYEDPSGKKPSVRMKRKKCGWSFDYFLKVLMA